MATLREYFDVDLIRCLSAHSTWEMRNQNGEVLHSIVARISQDFDGNAKYWSFFIESGIDVFSAVNALFNNTEVENFVLSPEGDGVYVEMGFSDYSERATSETLVFTKRIIIYIDELLGEATREQVKQLGLSKGFHVLVRDNEYALKRSEFDKPLAFISHDIKR